MLEKNTNDHSKLASDIAMNKWKLSHLNASELLSSKHSDIVAMSIIDIYKSLHLLFENEQQADNWIHQPNEYFNGITALQVMQESQEGMEKVQKYLKAQLY